jgi:subtilase family serine protease
MNRGSRKFALASSAVVAIVTAGCGVEVTEGAQPIETVHVRESVSSGGTPAIGRLPPEQVLQLDLVLPMRDPAGLKSFLAELYNPASASYRHFLTPSEFTNRFGPTEEDYETVRRYGAANSLEVVGGSRDGMEVQVKGSVASIEAAFHVNLLTYQHPTEDRTFYAPDREPSVDLPFPLWHISGLDNYSIPRPLHMSRDDYTKARGFEATAAVSHATTGSGPSASFLGSDMRAAYYGNGALTGAGQNLGLLEYYGTDLADLNTYYTNVGQTNNVPITLLSTDGTSTSCTYPSCDDTEQNLDMTQALGMAPGLASLVMYVGSTDTAIIGAMTMHNPLPTTIGCSWGWTPADASTLDPYFQKMAAQGQNFFAASGDYSTWKASGNAAAWPADDAYIVSVGGTDLVTASAAGPWASETAWSSSGGGISPDGVAIPSWQKLAGVINSSNHGSTTLRNGPDVSANANFTFYTCGDQQACQANYYGGTSFAAPMWAGFIALVNEQLASNGAQPIGFLNPTIYSQNVNASTYAADFHDITSGTSGSYSAVVGYDLVTGWGSPTASLVAALSGPPTPSINLSASPATVTVVQGNAGSSTITSTAVNGFNASVALSASGAPSGVTATFTPTSIAAPGSGSSSLSLAVGSSVAAGTYPITVTGTGGGVTQTTTVTLTVTTPAPAFSLSANPNSLVATHGGASVTSTITATITSGSPTIALSASGQPRNVTISFSPSSVSAGNPSSTMKVTASRRARTGTYTITVKGTASGASATTTVTLKVQ